LNYFEHHIGDYDKNTSHLSACEDGIYCRMIRRYLDKELPLDSDVEEIKRVVRARSREEKKRLTSFSKSFFLSLPMAGTTKRATKLSSHSRLASQSARRRRRTRKHV